MSRPLERIKPRPADRRKEIDREWKPLCMLKMRIDHMTGKEAIELVKNRQKK